MGVICTKQNPKNIINPQKRIKNSTITPFDDSDESYNYIGIEFQNTIEKHQSNFHMKKLQWEEYYSKRQEFINDEQYLTLLRSPNQITQLINDQQLQEQKVLQPIQVIALILKEPFKHSNLELFDAFILKELNTIKFNSLLMDGAIPKYRWNCWMAQVYSNSIYDLNLYSKLKDSPLQEKITDDIQKDINRTFPSHQYFKEINKGQEQLFSVLKALSLEYPEIGYCQGMNFVVGFCLIISGGKEEEVFWFIKFINQNPRFYWWEIYRGNFTFSKNLCQVFQDNLERQSQNLFNHFQKNSIFAFQHVWQWLLTQFLYSFPTDIVMYFWDFILASDILSILKIGLAYLKENENMLLDYDLYQLSEFFSSHTKKEKNMNITNILNKANQTVITMSDEQNAILKLNQQNMLK